VSNEREKKGQMMRGSDLARGILDTKGESPSSSVDQDKQRIEAIQEAGEEKKSEEDY